VFRVSFQSSSSTPCPNSSLTTFILPGRLLDFFPVLCLLWTLGGLGGPFPCPQCAQRATHLGPNTSVACPVRVSPNPKPSLKGPPSPFSIFPLTNHPISGCSVSSSPAPLSFNRGSVILSPRIATFVACVLLIRCSP